MRKYILSTGKSTTSPSDYAYDFIKTELHLFANSSPGSNVGSMEFSEDLTEEDAIDSVTDIMIEIFNKMGDLGILISLESVEIVSGEILIKVNIKGESKNYELK